MFWRIMPLKTFCQTAGFFWCKCFIQRSRGVGVEVVGNKDYLFRPWAQDIGSILENLCKIQCCPGLCHNGLSSACQRFGNHEHICHPVADIYRIHFFRLAWFAGYAYFLYELFVRFIYTDNRAKGIKGMLVNLQNILHS